MSQIIGSESKSQQSRASKSSSVASVDSDGRNSHGSVSQFQHYQHQYNHDLRNGSNIKSQYPTSSSAMTHGGSNKSLSSQNNATASRGPMPNNLQQTSQPVSNSSTGSTSVDNLSRLSQTELIQRVRKLEADLLKLASDHNHMIREANLRIQNQSTEMTTLKTEISRLEEDNTELRDLCCFLDDDRQKGRKLAREWQRFGRYTASVMRQEVAAYQSKLKELDTKQQKLISDNMELKELCLYLDEERSQISCITCGSAFRRDDGDGSSSNSTNSPEEYHNHRNSSTTTTSEDAVLIQGSGNEDIDTANEKSTQSTRNYNRNSPTSLNDNGNLINRGDSSQRSGSSTSTTESLPPPPPLPVKDEKGTHNNNPVVDYVRELERGVNEFETPEVASACPDSVLNALQVLQVCQQLDDHDIGDQEKAIVRQMCNVVWKKLEDNNPKF